MKQRKHRDGAARCRSLAVGGLLAITVIAGCRAPGTPTGLKDQPEDEPPNSRAVGTLVSVDGLGGARTSAVDINGSHQVVGTAETPEGHSRAFLWYKGQTRDLGTLGGVWSAASDINDWGQVAGTSLTSAGHARAFFWANGTMYEIGTLGGNESYGVAVSDAGQVVGYSTTKNGELHAFVWAHGHIRDLGTLGGRRSYPVGTNERGEIIGRSTTENGGSNAFLWTNGELSGLVPGHVESSTAVDISEKGHVLINARSGTRGTAYVWLNGSVTSLESPDGGTAVAADINDSGNAVGQISGSERRTRAVLWRRGEAIPLHSGEYARSSTATGINAEGAIAGTLRFSLSSNLRAFIWMGGSLETLDPAEFDRSPRSTTGIAVTDAGSILGLAHGPGDTVRSFLWTPSSVRTRTIPRSDN